MKTIGIILSGTFIATAGAAFAAGPTPVTPEPAPYQPVVAATPPAADWTGGYVGLSFGGAQIDAANDEESGSTYGIHAGYDYDFGSFVMGGELDYAGFGDFEVAGEEAHSVARLKVRAGADLGRAMVYGTVGAARLDSSLGEETGPVGGVGIEYMATDRFAIGAEFLAHRFEDVNDSGVDVDANTLAVRGSLRF